MAKKEYIGLTYESNRLRMARVQVQKNGLELIEVDTIDLPHPVSSIREVGLGDLDFSEGYEEIFEVEPTEPKLHSGSEFDDLEESSLAGSAKGTTGSPGLEESFDMTKTEGESEAAIDNEKLLADYLSQYGKRKLRIGTHIPFGKTSFQILKNVDPASMNKNDRRDFFTNKLRPIYEKEVEPDQYAWTDIGDNNCLLAYSAEENEFINLIELSETYFNGKILVHERLPDESIWAGLARVNYDLKDDDITGLIAIGDTSSRILFMKGQHIVNVLPIITEGENSNDILNTIFSKILFEIDKGDLPKITRLLIARSAKFSDKAKKYFDNQFEDVEVDFLTPNPNNLRFADEILNSPVYLQPYMTAIGAAWAASKIHEKEFSQLSLLPEYVRERQRVLRLEWHGILILILIALTPLFLNTLYQSKARELNDLQQQITILNNQIEDLHPLATMTEDLMGDLAEIQNENDRLLELAQYSQQWSEILRILNEGTSDISGIWLSSMSTSDNNSLIFSGYSRTRNQIPAFSSLFTDANIQRVTESEVRGETVYDFSVRVNDIRQDINAFMLEMPSRSFDAEQSSEVEIDFSSSRNPEESQDEPENLVVNSSSSGNSSNETDEVNPPETGRATITNETSLGEDRSNETDDSAGQPAPTTEVVVNKNSSSPYGLMGPEDELMIGAYTIVLHSITNGERAKQEEISLKGQGYKATLWPVRLKDNRIWWRIGVGQFQTVSETLQAVQELPEPYRNRNFIIDIHPTTE